MFLERQFPAPNPFFILASLKNIIKNHKMVSFGHYVTLENPLTEIFQQYISTPPLWARLKSCHADSLMAVCSSLVRARSCRRPTCWKWSLNFEPGSQIVKRFYIVSVVCSNNRGRCAACQIPEAVLCAQEFYRFCENLLEKKLSFYFIAY